MESKTPIASNDLRSTIELILSHWKIIFACLFISIGIAYTYLRYATFEYKAKATIKIMEESQSQKLPTAGEANRDLTSGSKNISDEMQIIKSRKLISNVVKDLKLNIRFFKEGNVIEQEIYTNPPFKINFFAADSIIHEVDTTLYVKIKSESSFLLFKDDGKSLIDRDENLGKLYSFGDRIKTGFGDMVIVPNDEPYKAKIGTNLKVSIKPLNNVVGKYQANILLDSKEDSKIIKMELNEPLPKKAIDILNQLIKEYNEDMIADKEEVVRITSDFINNRLQVVSDELKQVDFTAEQLQKKNKLTALNSQADIYLKNETQTEAQILNTSNKIQMISFLKEELNNNAKDSDLLPFNLGIEDASTSQIIKNHNDLVTQRDRLLKTSSEKNPVVINLNNQITALKNNLNTSLNNMQSTTEMTLKSLEREDARISSQLYSAPTKQRQFRDIKRQQDIKESLFLYLLEKREETAIRLGMFTPNAKIIEDAYSSYSPVAPNKMFTYLVAIILGLAIPIGAVYGINMLDTKIYTKEDLLSIVNAPYIGDIPRYGKGNENRLVSSVDYSPKAEAFRLLRTNIDFYMQKKWKGCKTIFVTSTVAQEGKSHTSVNLAMTIAHAGKKILLVETDIRVPNASKYLNVHNNKKGLTDYIIDKSLSVKDVSYPVEGKKGFDVIPSGTVPPNPAELLMSDRMIELFKDVKKNYDYVIVDTAAVGLVTDTLLITEHADLFVYVVSANNLDKRQLHVASTMYNEERLPNMVLLLNGTKKKAGYGYGYGYGGDKHKKKKWYDRIPFTKVNA